MLLETVDPVQEIVIGIGISKISHVCLFICASFAVQIEGDLN